MPLPLFGASFQLKTKTSSCVVDPAAFCWSPAFAVVEQASARNLSRQKLQIRKDCLGDSAVY